MVGRSMFPCLIQAKGMAIIAWLMSTAHRGPTRRSRLSVLADSKAEYQSGTFGE